MAGASSRFSRGGYDIPKYMLQLHGYSSFAHALGSFSDYFARERFLFVCRDLHDTPGFVRSECACIGLSEDRFDVVVLRAGTSGQAETVAAGLRHASVPAEEPLTIFNIDTFRPGFRHPDHLLDLNAIDGYLEVFEGDGESWSFVRPAEESAESGKVLEVAEKTRISSLCSDGLYHFRSAELYLSLYAEIAGTDPAALQGGERYVAPLYNIAIRGGMDIRYVRIAAEHVRFCGTPQEYESLRAGRAFVPINAGGSLR